MTVLGLVVVKTKRNQVDESIGATTTSVNDVMDVQRFTEGVFFRAASIAGKAVFGLDQEALSMPNVFIGRGKVAPVWADQTFSPRPNYFQLR